MAATPETLSVNARPSNSASSEELIDSPKSVSLPIQAKSLSPDTLRQIFSAALTDLSRPAYIEDDRISVDLRSGLNLLFDLLSHAELGDDPLLHALVHAAIAINMPFVAQSNSEIKLVHLNQADSILYDLKMQKHAGGDCQGCAYVKLQDDAGKLGKEDENDCACMLRLKKVIETEKEAVREFNWNGGTF